MKKLIFLLVLTMVVGLSVIAFAVEQNKLVNEKCGACHSTTVIYKKTGTQADWDKTYARMVSHGLQATPEQEKEIKAFLYTLKK